MKFPTLAIAALAAFAAPLDATAKGIRANSSKKVDVATSKTDNNEDSAAAAKMAKIQRALRAIVTAKKEQLQDKGQRKLPLELFPELAEGPEAGEAPEAGILELLNLFDVLDDIKDFEFDAVGLDFADYFANGEFPVSDLQILPPAESFPIDDFLNELDGVIDPLQFLVLQFDMLFAEINDPSILEIPGFED